ncbi:hypothetical protein [Limnobaculum xujianqingii]|uniref:hypothetical protein n=1 Tax=Limnobaculum xujianqingii TaxID=2738837 RepID=UPI001C4A7DAB|nr:hypothetical protein [Limnobaculum xujianqingii]
MTQTINVIAAVGVDVPLHDDPKRYITDGAIVPVPDNAYYRRCLACGDLLRKDLVNDPVPEVTAQSSLPAAAKSKEKTKPEGTDGQ